MGRAPQYIVTIILASLCVAAAPPSRYFKIKVVDNQTGRGVPLVELKTTNNLRYYTDSNGIVAFYEPGLMDQKVWFFVSSHGYEFPKDGFGMAGKALDVREGGSAELKIKRVNIAERLYRITGAGIYADSVLVGEPVPTRRPVLNAQVTGQDSTLAVLWRDKIYWFWGDTGRVSYPLGLFQMSGATSLPPGKGGLDPSVGIDLEYWVGPDGFSRKMAPTKDPGMMWLDGFVIVPDENGVERMVGHYARMKDLGTMLEHGISLWDEKEEVFKKYKELNLDDKVRCPRAHPVRVKEKDGDYFVFPTPYATMRVRAAFKDLVDPAAYEAFTCLAKGSRYDKANSKIERDGDGRLLYSWKRNTDPIDAEREKELIRAGKIKPDEARYQPRDVATSKTIVMHGGSIAWNDYRKKWIMIAVQIGGESSFLGEVWYAEADAITGPWKWARKIVTHNKYTFYNPVHHPFFDQDGGRLIYFEGTYANTFSGNPDQTPRYDYNQIMYRLDLSDKRLRLPAE
ncbi:MAG: DUF4185 domain-containing protein [Candidatus Sumerlaeia bacterium]|nr:DUF4185 domain-containing protein [Candidatus Sumerlaeia bacterium]